MLITTSAAAGLASVATMLVEPRSSLMAKASLESVTMGVLLLSSTSFVLHEVKAHKRASPALGMILFIKMVSAIAV